jgi:glutamine amidotransferase
MKPLVGVVDFGSAGNLGSVVKALQSCEATCRVIRDGDDFDGVTHVVLPGVGSFAAAMQALRHADLEAVLTRAMHTLPTLGICLGMQILADIGFEFGETEGLGLIRGEVHRMRCKGPVPHIGFARLALVGETSLFDRIPASAPFYFMHSYEMVNYTDAICLADYRGHQFVAAVQKRNVIGVQFHPEKSRQAGLQLLANFLAMGVDAKGELSKPLDQSRGIM